MGLGWSALNPMAWGFGEGAKAILGEDTLAGVPILNSITGSKSDEQKTLLKKQEQMAAELKKRQQQNEQARMNALGQSMLAFNPQNQMMAQMYGPGAAFSPQQFAQMAADPGAPSQEAFSAAHAEALRTGQPMQGIDKDQMARMEADKRRRAMIEQNMTPLGPGPAPLKPRTPQAARKY